MEKLHITSFVFNAWSGGNITHKSFVPYIKISFQVLFAISSTTEKEWERKYTIIVVIIVIKFDIKLDKKNTIERAISSFKKVFIIDQIMRLSICIFWKKSRDKKIIAWKSIISKIAKEKPKNFHKINSYLLIGLDKIKKIVFPSISLKSSWLHTKSTQIRPKISIIASQKSMIILLVSQIVNFDREIEKIINTNAKKSIIYKYLFLEISLNVFIAMFSIV